MPNICFDVIEFEYFPLYLPETSDITFLLQPSSEPFFYGLNIPGLLFRQKNFLHCILGILKEGSCLLHLVVAVQLKVIEYDLFEVKSIFLLC